MKLGIDCYSLHLQGWNVFQELEYAHKLGVDLLQTGPWSFESVDEGYLKRVRARANELGVQLEMAMGSICPTSATFDRVGTGVPFLQHLKSASSAETVVDHLRRMLHIADAVGSHTLRCFLGDKHDRQTELPIEAHIESTIKSCRSVRDLALDLGVTIAIENHAGDLQGRELKALIQEAGPEFVGACLDSGGALSSAAESPYVTLEHLAPCVVQSHIRDAAIWDHPRGAAVQSVAIGDGSIRIDDWARLFEQKCSRSAFTLEIITGSPPTMLNFLEPEFWDVYPNTPASELAQFLSLVRGGHPFMGSMLAVAGPWKADELPPEYQAALAVQQRVDLERSIEYCKEVLGFGERASTARAG